MVIIHFRVFRTNIEYVIIKNISWKCQKVSPSVLYLILRISGFGFLILSDKNNKFSK